MNISISIHHKKTHKNI